MDPALYENDEQKYSILKSNDGLRLEILADLLSSHLGIFVGQQKDGATLDRYTSAYFLGRHEVRREFHSNCSMMTNSFAVEIRVAGTAETVDGCRQYNQDGQVDDEVLRQECDCAQSGDALPAHLDALLSRRLFHCGLL